MHCRWTEFLPMSAVLQTICYLIAAVPSGDGALRSGVSSPSGTREVVYSVGSRVKNPKDLGGFAKSANYPARIDKEISEGSQRQTQCVNLTRPPRGPRPCLRRDWAEVRSCHNQPHEKAIGVPRSRWPAVYASRGQGRFRYMEANRAHDAVVVR